MTTACFTGHRKIAGQYYNHTNPTSEWANLKAYLHGALFAFMDQGIDHYISGMAIGVDQLAAETVALVRALKTPPIGALTAAMPFPSQHNNWPQATKDRYFELLKLCNNKQYTSADPYTAQKMIIRDIWMVDHSDYVIAIWDGREKGGTWHTYSYARQQGKPVFHIDPIKFSGVWINGST